MHVDYPTWPVARFFANISFHDDVTEWNHFPRYWPFVPRIHRLPVKGH